MGDMFDAAVRTEYGGLEGDGFSGFIVEAQAGRQAQHGGN